MRFSPALVATTLFLLGTACLNERGLNPPWLDGGIATGGTMPADGAMPTGGTIPTGGAVATGGAHSGGTGAGGKSTGGSIAAGGVTATGGSPSTGGAVGTGGGAAGGQGGASVCPPVCDIACPNGNVLDARGCATCTCKPPVCPAVKCTTNCLYGYAKDSKGCDSCTCSPAPACSTADCGPTPDAPVFACVGGGSTGKHCGRNTSGACVWTFEGCQGGACNAPITCSSSCLSGYQRNSDQCTTCGCVAPLACDTCQGPPSQAPVTQCDDGTEAGNVCVRGGMGPGPSSGCNRVRRTCPTVPSSACSRFSASNTCGAHSDCVWLVSGCSAPALEATGCYAVKEVGCQSDNDCGNGQSCVQRNINPCQGIDTAHCASCAATISVCVQ